jgi:hypothetical protein
VTAIAAAKSNTPVGRKVFMVSLRQILQQSRVLKNTE